MKKIIINTRQLSRLTEAVTGEIPVIDVEADDVNDASMVGTDMAKKVAASGADMAKVRVVPKNADREDIIDVKGEGDSVADQIKDAQNKTVRSGMDKNKTAFTTVIGSDGNPVEEGKRYTKKEISESRIYNLNKNGKKYTKSEMNSILLKNNEK